MNPYIEIVKQQTAELIAAVRECQAQMTADERKSFWIDLMDGYCEYCGGDRLPRHCWNDE